MTAPNEHRVQRMNVERLRRSPVSMIQVLTSDVIRQHLDRIEPATVADLFALSEIELPAALAADLANWAARACREILDMPEGDPRQGFLEAVARIPADLVPARMRDAVNALEEVGGAATVSQLRSLQTAWAAVPPAAVVLPVPTRSDKPRVVATKPAKVSTPRAPRTPAAMVDPRRAEWIREDAMVRLSAREYAERGLKESVFVDGIRHRSPYKDLTSAEVLTELRKLERERKLKHTADRWIVK